MSPRPARIAQKLAAEKAPRPPERPRHCACRRPVPDTAYMGRLQCRLCGSLMPGSAVPLNDDGPRAA
jgi:hypothetical protein